MDTCLRNVYITFFFGLLIFIGFMLLYKRLNAPVMGGWGYLGILILLILLIYFISRMSMGIGKILVAIVFLAALAFIFYPLILGLSSSDLWKFVLITLLFFVVLSVIVFLLPMQTFASWGKVLFILLILLIVFGIVGSIIFRDSPQFRLVFYILILLVFGGLIMYDTYRIASGCGQQDAVNSAMSLILDTANVFGATSGIGTL